MKTAKLLTNNIFKQSKEIVALESAVMLEWGKNDHGHSGGYSSYMCDHKACSADGEYTASIFVSHAEAQEFVNHFFGSEEEIIISPIPKGWIAWDGTGSMLDKLSKKGK